MRISALDGTPGTRRANAQRVVRGRAAARTAIGLAFVAACALALASCASKPVRGGVAPQPLAATPAPVVIPEGDSSANLQARKERALAALASRPSEFLLVQPRLAADGEIYAAVRNRAAIPATGVKFVVAVVDRTGAIKDGPYEIDLGGRSCSPPRP